MIAYSHDVPGGGAWSLLVPSGKTLRLECLAEGAVATMLIYSARSPLERLNIPDTLKAQMSGRIRPSMVLMSDLGLALASVTGSSLDWHDAITGYSHPRHLARHGVSDYQQDRNGWRRSGRELLLDELCPHGLDERDLHPSVNWFAKVVPADDGTLAHVPSYSSPGDWVELRAEQELLIVLATAPHPMSTEAWSPGGVRVTVGAEPSGPASVSDRAEAGRALAMAARLPAGDKGAGV